MNNHCYLTETAALLRRLIHFAVQPMFVSDASGEELHWNPTDTEENNVQQLTDHIVQGGECHLHVDVKGEVYWIYIITGNNPGELVSDFQLCGLLDKIMDDHGDTWENAKLGLALPFTAPGPHVDTTPVEP